MILDGTNLILGRVGTTVAKKSLLGEKIDIINCEKIVITGKKKAVLAKYKRIRVMGIHTKGPFMPRMADRFVRRAIRGMLPYKQEKGLQAYKRIMCYKGMPSQFEGQKTETIKEANIDKVPNLNYIKVEEICKEMGAKQ